MKIQTNHLILTILIGLIVWYVFFSRNGKAIKQAINSSFGINRILDPTTLTTTDRPGRGTIRPAIIIHSQPGSTGSGSATDGAPQQKVSETT